jgi:hypothetical protein
MSTGRKYIYLLQDFADKVIMSNFMASRVQVVWAFCIKIYGFASGIIMHERNNDMMKDFT